MDLMTFIMVFCSCFISTIIRFDFMNRVFDKKIDGLHLSLIKILYLFIFSCLVYLRSPFLNIFCGLILTLFFGLYCFSSTLKKMFMYNLFLYTVLMLLEVGMYIVLNSSIILFGIQLDPNIKLLIEYVITQLIIISIYSGFLIRFFKKQLRISLLSKHYLYFIGYLFYLVIAVFLISDITTKYSEFLYIALFLELGLLGFSFGLIGIFGSAFKGKGLLENELKSEKELHELQLKFERNIFHEALERKQRAFDEKMINEKELLRKYLIKTQYKHGE